MHDLAIDERSKSIGGLDMVEKFEMIRDHEERLESSWVGNAHAVRDAFDESTQERWSGDPIDFRGWSQWCGPRFLVPGIGNELQPPIGYRQETRPPDARSQSHSRRSRAVDRLAELQVERSDRMIDCLGPAPTVHQRRNNKSEKQVDCQAGHKRDDHPLNDHARKAIKEKPHLTGPRRHRRHLQNKTHKCVKLDENGDKCELPEGGIESQL